MYLSSLPEKSDIHAYSLKAGGKLESSLGTRVVDDSISGGGNSNNLNVGFSTLISFFFKILLRQKHSFIPTPF